MTMRAVVTRNQTVTNNNWGGPAAPSFDKVATIACRAWTTKRRDVSDDGKAAVIHDMRALVPKGADVQEGDRLEITDRMGNVKFGGPVAVETIDPVSGPGSSTSHYELMLTRHL